MGRVDDRRHDPRDDGQGRRGESGGDCVAQFTKQTSHAQKLKEFEEASGWTRPEFIEKGGWDKMPGQDKASDGVARACADGVALLIKK